MIGPFSSCEIGKTIVTTRAPVVLKIMCYSIDRNISIRNCVKLWDVIRVWELSDAPTVPQTQFPATNISRDSHKHKWDAVSISDNTTFDEGTKCLIGKSLDHMQRNPEGSFFHIASFVTFIRLMKSPFMNRSSFLLNRTPKI